MAGPRVIHAAGGIVWRPRHPRKGSAGGGNRVEILLVHRPRYDDWSFPKGKPDRGESLPVTAVREIDEETGHRVRLGHPLPETLYRVRGGMKRVSYWVATPVGPPRAFVPNAEVDEVRWVRVKDARKLLTYDHDRMLLKAFSALRDVKAHRTRTVIVLRHAQARVRTAWRRNDLDRPLTKPGQVQSAKLTPLLHAYGASRIVASPAVRCVETVEPYATSVKALLEVDDRLSEESGAKRVARLIETVLQRKRPTVVCTHRPTLPWIFARLGIEPHELAPGEGIVVHHRKGRVVAMEQFAHRAPRT